MAESPTPRAIYIERLVSQNRNSTQQIRYGQQANQSDWVILGGGGSLNLAIGQSYFIELTTATSTAYDQLQSFLTLSNTIFQIKSVSTTYSTLTAPPTRVPTPNPSLYADGCLWQPNLDSPNWRSCLASGKAGGTVVTVYEISIISGGGESVGLEALIYDLSGGSFHYNTDFSQSPGDLNTFDPTDAGFAKRFIPSTIAADGVATLRFTISNPNPITVAGYRFTDNLPGNMVVASPANASSSCGGTIAATPGSGVVAFVDGAIGPNGTCTILVNVTVPFDPMAVYPVTLNNVADLFIGDAVDPSATAMASLVVTEEPAPPLLCGPGTLAQWTFPSSNNNPAAPNPAVANVTASAAAGAGLQASGGLDFAAPYWRSNTNPNVANLAAAITNNMYFEFVLDTTGIDAIDLRFTRSRQPNGPEMGAVLYGTNPAALTNAGSFTILATDQTITIPLAAALNPAGNTLVRIYVFAAPNTANAHRARISNVNFEGEICLPIDPADAPTPPSISKSFSPNPVRVGEPSTLSFTITNPNPADSLSGLTFRDELPGGMQAVIGSFVNGGCGGTWGLEAGNPAILALTDGSLAANTLCTLSVDVTATAIGSNVNISDPVDAIETLPGNSAQASLDVLPPPLAPSIVKLFDPNPLLDPNGVTTLLFRITNNDPDLAISQVAFSDVLPLVGGVQMQPAIIPIVFADNGQCGAYGFVWNAGSSTLSFSNGEIAAAAFCEIEISVEVPGLNPMTDLPAQFPNQTSTVSHVFEGITYQGNQASATLLVDLPIPGIALLKQVGPGNEPVLDPWSNYLAVPVGGQLFYKITIENIGETVLTDIVVTDIDPNVDLSGCPWTAMNFELPVADASDPLAHIAVCVVGPVSAVTGETVNTATANADSSAGPVSDSDSATYATTGLTLAKTANPTTFTGVGNEITYTFTVTNTGFAVLSPPLVINDPMIGGVNCPAFDTVGDLDEFFDPGEQIACTATYLTTADDVDAGQVLNRATASTPEVTSDPDSETVTFVGPALTIVKSAPASAVVNQAFDYTLTVTNNGTAATTAVATVTDVIPTGVTINSVTNPGCTTAGQTVTCTVPAGLAAGGGSVVFTINVTPTVNATNPIVNSAGVVGGGDPNCANPGDCTDSTSTPLNSPALTIVKGAPASAVVNQPFDYTLTVTNNGTAATTAVATVTDVIPAGVTINSATNPGCAIAGQTVTCTVAAGLAAGGGSVVFTINVTPTVDATNPIINSAGVVGGGDPNCANPGDCTDSTSTPLNSPALTIVKGAPASVVVNQPFDYTLTVTNNGTAATTAVATVTDVIPAGVTINSATNPGCAIAGQTVTCTVPAGLAAGGGTVVFTINVTPTVDATNPIVNSAGVVGGGDPNCANPGDCTDSTSTPLNSPALTIVKDAPKSAVVNQAFNYTLSVTNNGTAATTAVEDTLTTPVPQNPALQLLKFNELIDLNGNGLADEGEVIEYTLVATNTGNVTLTEVAIVDPMIGALNCAPTQPVPVLIPGAVLTCTGSWTVTQAAAILGQPIVNMATATGLPPDGILLTDADSTVTPIGSPLSVPVPVPGPGMPALILLALGILMISRRSLAMR